MFKKYHDFPLPSVCLICSFRTQIIFSPQCQVQGPQSSFKIYLNIEQVSLHSVRWRRGACASFSKAWLLPRSCYFTLWMFPRRRTHELLVCLCFCHRYTSKSWTLRGAGTPPLPWRCSQPWKHNVLSPNGWQALCHMMLHKNKNKVSCGQAG